MTAEWPRAQLLAAGCALLAVLLWPTVAPADRAFTPRFSTNVSGDIAIAANTLESCASGEARCPEARAGKPLNNNAFAMAPVNVDSGAGRFDSSSATLALPTGARVLFAGLYWGARSSAGAGGSAAPNRSPAARSTVALRVPGGGAFETIGPAATVLDDSVAIAGAYQGFADVTRAVANAGSGTYTLANVQAGTGEDRYAGWALVVAYADANEPPRNLTVFDGLTSVSQSAPATTIPVSGFETPRSGAVRTRLGFVAYEGDLGASGDSVSLDGHVVADVANPANNFFDSSISNGGRHVTDKLPNYVNQLGFDANIVDVSGLLANGAHGADIGLRTTSDQYLPGVITFATDFDRERFASLPQVAHDADLSLTDDAAPSGLFAGEGVEFTLLVHDAGPREASAVRLRDELPAGLVVDRVEAPGDGCSTTAADVDCALGALEAGGSAQVTIEAVADASLAGMDLSDAATVSGEQPDPDPVNNDASTGVDVFAPPAGAPVGSAGAPDIAPEGPAASPEAAPAAPELPPSAGEGAAEHPQEAPLAPALQAPPTATGSAVLDVIEQPESAAGTPASSGESGDTVDFRITIRDDGPDAASDVSILDTPSDPAQLVRVVPSSGDCAEELPLRCVIGELAAGGVATIELELRPLAPGPLRNTISAVAAQPDPAPAAALASDVLPVAAGHATVHVQERTGQGLVADGERFDYLVRVSAAGSTAAVDLDACAHLPGGLGILGAPGASVHGHRLCWHLAVLPGGQSHVFFVAVLPADVAAGSTLVSSVLLTAANAPRQRARATVVVLASHAVCAGGRATGGRARVAC